MTPTLAASAGKPLPSYRAPRRRVACASARRDKGLVLKSSGAFGEADRVVTVLTEKNGLVRAVAKGAKKTTSRFGARLEPFMYCDFLWSEPAKQQAGQEGWRLGTIGQAEFIRPYGFRIVKKYGSYVAAGVIAEVSHILSENDVLNSKAYYALTHGAFAALARQAHPSESIASSYLIRALAIAGWPISLRSCSRCSSSQVLWFSAALGGLACRQCKPGASSVVSGSVRRLLAALAEGDWAVADRAEEKAREEASALVSQYALWHLGAQIKSQGLPKGTARI